MGNENLLRYEVSDLFYVVRHYSLCSITVLPIVSEDELHSNRKDAHVSFYSEKHREMCRRMYVGQLELPCSPHVFRIAEGFVEDTEIWNNDHNIN